MFSIFGRYVLLMLEAFKRPDKGKVFRKQLMAEFLSLGVDSLGIVVFISAFTGAIVAIQTSYNIDTPLIPDTMVGFTVRQSIILEFAPTIISIVLAGKVGSSIASQIGTMRVTEQIDALKIMGVNPANYLILPKITASMIINPILITISIACSLAGGWLAMIITGLVSSKDYIIGLQAWFEPFTVFYALIKTVIFAFTIASVSGYQGYYTKRGSLEVGRASTRAVVYSSILIIISDLVLTQMLLT